MNRKYIGLAKRELLLAKKAIMIGLLTYFALMAIGVLIYLSLRFGNMKEWLGDPEMQQMILPMFKVLFIGMGAITPITAFCQSCDENMISDLQCGWQKFSYTLPVSIDEQIKLKFGMKVIGLAPALVLGLINLFAISAARGEAPDKYAWMIFWGGFFFGIISTFIQLPLIIKTRSHDKAGMAMMGFMMAIAMGAMFKLTQNIRDFREANGLDDLSDLSPELQSALLTEQLKSIKNAAQYAWVVPIVTVIAAAAAIVWTRKILKERIC